MDEERTKIEKVSTFVCRHEIIKEDFRSPPTDISHIGKQSASSAVETFYLFSALISRNPTTYQSAYLKKYRDASKCAKKQEDERGLIVCDSRSL